MTILQAAILGIIQGIGEFLPISSSGHLVLAPWLLNWQDPGLAFDVALHFGTLLAVTVFFAKDWWHIFYSGFTGKSSGGYSAKILWLLALASVPGALAGYLLEDLAENQLRHPLLVALMLAGVGLLLFWVDRKSQGVKSVGDVSVKDAMIVGCAQACAIIPGVSRSGSTITAALGLGFDRVSAARFSFLMSTPIIFGAALLKNSDLLAGGLDRFEIVGIASAAISGYLAIVGLLKLVSRVSYAGFFWYRLALASLIVIFWFSH